MEQSPSTVVPLDTLASLAAKADERFDLLPKYQKSKWSQLMLANLFRQISYKELVSRCRKLFGALDYKKMWRACCDTGYVVKNLKAWLFACVKKGLRGSAADALAVDYDIMPQDLGLRLLMSPELRKWCATLASSFRALSLSRYDANVVHIYHDIHDWLGKFVYRKLRFVYQQQGLSEHDMKMEVFTKGVHALYLTYPRVHSKLHAINIVKSAAHNHGINLIMQATGKKRARLIQETDNTFSALVVSIDEILQTSELQAPDTRASEDVRIDVGRLFTSLKNSHGPDVELTDLFSGELDPTPLSKRQRLLALLMGYEDKEFSKWLNTHYRIRSECSDYIERADRSRFLKLACQFLAVPEQRGNELLARLRIKLAAYSLQ